MKYDVVVIGGGFAGVGAAIAAAREGKKVRLVEKYNALGGAAVYDLVTPFMRYWAWMDDAKNEKLMLCGSIFSEVIEELDRQKAFWGDTKLIFNDEHLKIILNRMAIDAGVELLFGTQVVGVKMNGKKIEAVEISNVSGRSEIYADVFVDATGDANVATFAGFPFELGRKSDGLCQPMTLSFRVYGVSREEYFAIKDEVNRLYAGFKKQGKLTNPRDDVLVLTSAVPNMLQFNSTRVIRLDPTNIEDVTKAEIEAREQVFELYNFLRENFEPFKRSALVSTGIQIGVRESRRIVGEYTVDSDELVACTKFEDGIAACCYAMDMHSPDGGGTTLHHFGTVEYSTIPYRCLVPKESENRLVAGRCISVTHEALASLRVMPTVCTMGEAAGVAAAMACDEGVNVGKINVDRLREKLKNKGNVID